MICKGFPNKCQGSRQGAWPVVPGWSRGILRNHLDGALSGQKEWPNKKKTSSNSEKHEKCYAFDVFFAFSWRKQENITLFMLFWI